MTTPQTPDHTTQSKLLNVTDLDPAAFNPPNRTTSRALAALKEDIARNGVLSPVHTIPKKAGGYVLVDGHRRTEIARQLAIPRLMAVIHNAPETDAVSLWASLNRNTRTVGGRDWLAMWWLSDGKAEKDLPPGVRKEIKELVRIFGRSYIKELVEPSDGGPGFAPNVVSEIVRLHTAIVRRDCLKPHPTEREVGLWMLKHREQAIVHAVMRSDVMNNLAILRKLIRRLRNDETFDVQDMMGRSIKAGA